jgi:hypothetical protein
MAGSPFSSGSRASEARSGGGEAKSGGEDADLASRDEDPADGKVLHLCEQWRRRPMDGLGGPIHRFSLFYFINRGGHQTASKNSLFSMTLCSRQLGCPPRKITFAHLGKGYCSSVNGLQDALRVAVV